MATRTIHLICGQSNARGAAQKVDLTDLRYDITQTDVRQYTRLDTVFGGTASAAMTIPSGSFSIEAAYGYHLRNDAGELPLIFRDGWSGTSLAASWQPEAAGGEWANALDALWLCYEAAKTEFAGDELRFGSLVWIQGEADVQNSTFAAAYEANLVKLGNAFRGEFGANLPIIFVQLSEFCGVTEGSPGDLDLVRAAYVSAAATLGNTAVVDATPIALQVDNVHYTADGLMALGDAVYTAYTTLAAGTQWTRTGRAFLSTGDVYTFANVAQAAVGDRDENPANGGFGRRLGAGCRDPWPTTPRDMPLAHPYQNVWYVPIDSAMVAYGSLDVTTNARPIDLAWSNLIPAGATPWTPSELGASLVLWLDADDASTITLNGSTVSQWNDKSGNGRNASQATAANQPTYTTSGLNGKNVLTFSNLSDTRLSIPNGVGDYFPYQSAFIVYSDTSTLSYVTPLGARYGGVSGAPYHGHVDNTGLFSSQYTSPETLNGDNFKDGTDIGDGTSTARPSTPAIFSYVATGQFDVDRRFSVIGTDASITTGRSVTGLIAEVIILENAASTADRQKIEGYLAWNWGLEGNLPAGHPYKSAPPTVVPTAYDSDAQAYITAVETADGQALETAVKDAINDFVVGCKADGIWTAIKASCILAGARTLNGALQPLVGTAPTNFNFVSGDYDRKTGLQGNGSTKYLNTNVSPSDGLQNSAHYSTYTTSLSTNPNLDYMGATQTVPFSSFSQVIDNAGTLNITLNSGVGASMAPQSGNIYTGFFGADRPSATVLNARYGGSNITVTNHNSVTPTNLDYYVFGRNLNGVADRLSDRAHTFYSIGESLGLALLNARVTTLMAAIGTAIP